MNLAVVFDTETTGLPAFKEPSESPLQPHLVQLAANLVDQDSGIVIQSMDVIIKPDGWIIPEEVVEKHGITTEYALAVGIPEKQALEMFLALWAGRTRVAHNTTFDNRIIRIATKRYCSEAVIDAWQAGEYECTMQRARKVMAMGKPPTLAEAYKHFTGNELENAHSAMPDTNACMEIHFALRTLALAA